MTHQSVGVAGWVTVLEPAAGRKLQAGFTASNKPTYKRVFGRVKVSILLASTIAGYNANAPASSRSVAAWPTRAAGVVGGTLPEQRMRRNAPAFSIYAVEERSGAPPGQLTAGTGPVN